MNPPLPQDNGESIRIRVSPGCVAIVTYEGLVTQKAVRKLIKQLELSIDDYPEVVPAKPTTENADEV